MLCIELFITLSTLFICVLSSLLSDLLRYLLSCALSNGLPSIKVLLSIKLLSASPGFGFVAKDFGFVADSLRQELCTTLRDFTP